jgi:hypothetical protein
MYLLHLSDQFTRIHFMKTRDRIKKKNKVTGENNTPGASSWQIYYKQLSMTNLSQTVVHDKFIGDRLVWVVS